MKILKVNVTAQAFDRNTGKSVGKQRTEEINLVTNKFFKNCKTVIDIKNTYESFWNDLNPKSKEVVFVQRVKITEVDRLTSKSLF